jgi:hypothetical protein
MIWKKKSEESEGSTPDVFINLTHQKSSSNSLRRHTNTVRKLMSQTCEGNSTSVPLFLFGMMHARNTFSVRAQGTKQMNNKK